MWVIQYCTTDGHWITINSCGTFSSYAEADKYMKIHCASIIHKRVISVK